MRNKQFNSLLEKAKNRKPIPNHFLLVLLFFLFVFGGTSTFAQISLTNPNITPQEAVNNVLLGAGVTASNITFNGSAAAANIPKNSVRHFTNTSANFPLDEGVLMQTDGAGNINDADLSAITTNTVTNGAIIEFDFVPQGDSLSFSYIFASREYASYTCANYNDVFGFFISGPGINGPYSNNAQNIATVPGSNNVPVGINTVNAGTNPDFNNNCHNADPNWQSNSVFFTTSYNSVYNNSNIPTSYNGSTVELTANATVICGETYHIKLAISNVMDQLFDSGVFLKAGSFSSEPLVEVNSNNTTSNFLDSVVVEGCDEGNFCFERPASESDEEAVVHYSISGSATQGVDYTFPNLPNQGDSILLHPGESEFCIDIIPIDDGITEGLENIVLTTYAINACGDTTFSVGELWIADKPQDLTPDAGQDLVVCDGGVGVLNGTPTTNTNDVEWSYSGPGNITFSPNTEDLNAEITFDTPGSYTVYLTETNDTCAMQEVDSIQVLYGEVELVVSNDTTICENGEAILNAFATGSGTFTYFWDHTNDSGSSQSVFPTSQTTYTVYAESDEGCVTTTENITVDVLPSLSVTSSASQTICPGDSIVLTANGAGGNGGPYTYVWSDQDGATVGTGNVINVSPDSTTTYTVEVADNCETTPVTNTTEIIVAILPEIQFSVVDGELCTPAIFEIINETDSQLVENAHWFVSDGQAFVNNDSIHVGISSAGTYDVRLVVETPDGCIDSATVNDLLTVYPKPAADFTYYPKPATILNTEVNFQNYSPGAVEYEWSFEEGNPLFSILKDPIVDFPEGKTGNYEVELVAISEFECTDTVRKIVSVVPEVLIFAPNSFTPDGDQHNPTWKPSIEGIDKMNVDIEIYNRWGEKIWESHNLDVGWDGTYGTNSGTIVKSGAYIWKVNAVNIINDQKYEWTGVVNVLH